MDSYRSVMQLIMVISGHYEAFIAENVSLGLGDVEPLVLVLGTVSSAVAGSIGGFAAAFKPKPGETTS